MSMYECAYCGSEESTWPDFIIVDFRIVDSGFRNKIWLECGFPNCNDYKKYEKYLDILYQRIYNCGGRWFCSPECAIKYIIKSRRNALLPEVENFLLEEKIKDLELRLARIKLMASL